MTEMSSPSVGLVYDDRYLQHNVGLQVMRGSRQPLPFVEPTIHPSNYRFVMRTKHLIDLTGLSRFLARIEPRPATVEEVARCHSPAYVERVERLCAAGGGDAGQGAPAGPGSYEIALLSAGGAIAAVDAVMRGQVKRVFANIRPPGHHAMPDLGVGYCIFGNAAIAAKHARQTYGLERILILDWDVHSGNGTQTAFYEDPGVLFCSLHQDGFYIYDLGRLEETGHGAGLGYTVNLPLPAGSGDAAYLAALDRIVLPIGHAYQPQLVLVSAGQDAAMGDTHGRMCVSSEGYRQLTDRIVGLAEAHAGGRIVFLQEGGYSETYGPYCTLGIVEALLARRTGIEEPNSPEWMRAQPATTRVGASAEAALAGIRARHLRYWPTL